MAEKTVKSTKVAAATTTAPTTQVAQPPVDKKAAMAKAREAKEKVAEGDRFFYLGTPKEGSKKLAPQAQVIVNAIEAAGKDGITRKDLVDGLKGVLVTKQPETRIVGYYQKPIIEAGWVELRAAA